MSATIRSILCSFISGKGRPGSLISEKGRLFCSKVSPSPPKPPTSPAAIDAADQSSVKRPTVSAAGGIIDGQCSPPIPLPAPSAQGERGRGKDFSDFASFNVEDDSSDFNKFKALAHANAAAGGSLTNVSTHNAIEVIINPPCLCSFPFLKGRRQKFDDSNRMDEYIAAFESWALKHDIVDKSMEERLHRFQVFKDRLKCIEKTKEIVNYRVGLTDFSDLTTEEFGRKYLRGSFGNRWPPFGKMFCRCCSSDTSTDEIHEKDFKEFGNDNPKMEEDSSDLDGMCHSLRSDGCAITHNFHRTSSCRNGKFLYRNIFHFGYENVCTKDLPKSLDWRAYGAVTPVRHQLDCDCGWACSAIAAMEGIIKIKTGVLLQLSVQELIDCDVFNRGCRGGNPALAFIYTIVHGGIHLESDYRTVMSDQGGRYPPVEKLLNIGGFEFVPPNDEDSFLKALAHQPICVAIDANSEGFREYTGGIFYGPRPRPKYLKREHVVTAVGYGIDEVSGEEYILLKNSWGSDWGEGGFMKILRCDGTPEGVCGIYGAALYPTM